METVFQANNIRFHLVPHQVFKTISIVVKLKGDLSRDTITSRALLPYVLRQGTNTYPDRRTLQLYLDDLYGADLSLQGGKKGDNHIITLRLTTANQKYIANTSSILDEALDFVREVLFNPNVDADGFSDEVVEREKTTLKHKIESITDDKMAYANMRLFDEMCEGEPFQLHTQGYTEDLEDITADNLYEYYKRMLTEDEMDIFVLGDINEQTVQETLKQTFTKNHHAAASAKQQTPPQHAEKQALNTVIENQSVQQAKLHIGYRTNCTYADKDYGALQVFNGLFGGFPSSKLFINVREKNSLAYYAASQIESHKGLMLVLAGIAPEDYEQARDIIFEQLKAMKSGDFTEEEVEETKGLVVNSLLETLDSPNGIIEMLYQQVPADIDRDPQALIDRVKSVTKADVVNAAERIEADTLYLLTDNNGGGDNE